MTGGADPIRVILADDSSGAREHIRALLERDGDIEVVATAEGGAEAVALAQSLRPDVVALDANMPGVDGFEAAGRIMQESARPVILLGSARQSADPESTRRALEAGALMLVAKPVPGAPSPGDLEETALAETIRLTAGVRVITRRRPRARSVAPAKPADERRRRDIVAIAASTGGPAAIAAVLGGLRASLPVPVVVVQHIAAGFDRGLATWLDRVTSLDVSLARDDEPLRPGQVRLAPSDVHLCVTPRGHTRLSDEPPVDGHRPSATYMFRSVARAYGPRALAVILTGMGRDGVSGLVDVERAGGRVLAQDQSSSVVYGMPSEAVELGAAHRVLHLCDIPAAIEHEIAHDLASV